MAVPEVPTHSFGQAKWQRREIDNFSYLMFLNEQARQRTAAPHVLLVLAALEAPPGNSDRAAE